MPRNNTTLDSFAPTKWEPCPIAWDPDSIAESARWDLADPANLSPLDVVDPEEVTQEIWLELDVDFFDIDDDD